MSCTLIEHGHLISMKDRDVVSDGAIAFKDSRIIYVGPAEGFDRAGTGRTPSSTRRARQSCRALSIRTSIWSAPT